MMRNPKTLLILFCSLFLAPAAHTSEVSDGITVLVTRLEKMDQHVLQSNGDIAFLFPQRHEFELWIIEGDQRVKARFEVPSGELKYAVPFTRKPRRHRRTQEWATREDQLSCVRATDALCSEEARVLVQDLVLCFLRTNRAAPGKPLTPKEKAEKIHRFGETVQRK